MALTRDIRKGDPGAGKPRCAVNNRLLARVQIFFLRVLFFSFGSNVWLVAAVLRLKGSVDLRSRVLLQNGVRTTIASSARASTFSGESELSPCDRVFVTI
ncbi:hypothetical protein P691DRAFT_295800 [Macrolepiota fuliginosa MF-IS2]|uniref:Uncharacterized protein n=1 Tax=Macrolepiota fuliginosa MF-IS2 TaxID=1400762 RepID=A0A9P6C4K5_9AGAR|nr:hypothetical protein P691DRAFT_295800 [Macrolepiota fuliginosa MF-IS2]